MLSIRLTLAFFVTAGFLALTVAAQAAPAPRTGIAIVAIEDGGDTGAADASEDVSADQGAAAGTEDEDKD